MRSKKGLSLPPEFLIVMLIVIIFGVIIMAGGGTKLWELISQSGKFSACNTNMQKCSCLLYKDGGDKLKSCPSGTISSDYSDQCPRTCNQENFKEQLKAAKKAKKEGSTDFEVFGHCCRGDFQDWELE